MSTDDEQSIIEKEFAASWDRPEDFFARVAQITDEGLQVVYDLIVDLKGRGYDKQLRAGTSLFSFILSRSREWGLRREQPRVIIGLKEDGGMAIKYREGDYWTQAETERFGFTPELQEFLDKLLKHPID
jgi:hypothetical protein